jgi:probable HAF family extracellular repeat protein
MAATLAAQDNQDHRNSVRYSLKVLPTLGGTFGQAWGINNRGLVAGPSTLLGDTTGHAFLWSNGVITDLGSLGGPISLTFTKPNEKGEVAGYSTTSTLDPNGEDFCNGLGTFLVCLPFIWQNGVMTALPTLGGTNGQASGINNRGQIAGVSETPNIDPCSFAFLQVEAVIWEKGKIQELPPFPGDAIGSASAINDSGQVVGATGCITTNTVRAVLWPDGPNGGVVDLGNLGGTAFDIAFDINNRGQVVGQSNLHGEILHHGFLWQNGMMTDLGSLPGLPTSLANAINNQGQVVGFSQDANGDDSSSVAWIWQEDVMTDLNTVIASGSPLFLKEALAINDRGQIAGYGLLSDGENRGFLLTPCNEGEEGCKDNAPSAATAASPAIQTTPANLDSSAPRPRMPRPFGRGWAGFWSHIPSSTF